MRPSRSLKRPLPCRGPGSHGDRRRQSQYFPTGLSFLCPVTPSPLFLVYSLFQRQRSFPSLLPGAIPVLNSLSASSRVHRSSFSFLRHCLRQSTSFYRCRPLLSVSVL